MSEQDDLARARNDALDDAAHFIRKWHGSRPFQQTNAECGGSHAVSMAQLMKSEMKFLADEISALKSPERASPSGRGQPSPEQIAAEIIRKAERAYETSGDDGGWNAMTETLRTEICAALAASPAADGWLPIETAPKDGTPFMSWDGKQCAVIVYHPFEHDWYLAEGDNKPHPDCPIEWDFTHWRPLPAPPAGNELGKS